MPENSIQNQASYPKLKVVSTSKNFQKKEPIKYNKPHCIIPVADMSWVLNQVKSIQVLWNECWQSDPYGSRWVKLTTTLKSSSFRLARKVLYTAGLFQFKRDTSSCDSRKTESWSIINLHGARRINDFWNSEPIAATDTPIAATDAPISATDSAISAKNSRFICSETPAPTGVSEPLSNSSLSFQELLKEVPGEELTQESELVEQVPTLAPTFVEVTTALILELRSRGTKKADKQAFVHERCLRHYKQPDPNLGFRESFITTYNWRIDEQRFQRLQNLTVECKRSFFEKFENLYGIYRKNLPEIFDRIFSIINSSALNYQSN